MEHGDQAVQDMDAEEARASYFPAPAEPEVVLAEAVADRSQAVDEAPVAAAPDAGEQLQLPEVPVRPRAPRRRAPAKEAADLPLAEAHVAVDAAADAPVRVEPTRALTVVLPEPLALMARALERAKEPLACPLCTDDGGELVVRLPACRVIRATEPGFPAFYRVIWNSHVAEWTDLPEADQLGLMRVVNTVERTLRDLLHPTKINLASLGNVVPHLHWHVVARFDWDSHFPAPIWGPAQRKVEPAHTAVLEQLMPQVDEVLRQRLVAW